MSSIHIICESFDTNIVQNPEKKDPLRGSFFSYRPSAGAAPSVRSASSNCFHRTHDQAQRDAASPRSVLAIAPDSYDVLIGTVQPFGVKRQTMVRKGTKVENKSWKSVSGKPFPAIATCFWKIERAVWSSGNIPFTVLTSFNFKVVIAERITMESQKKKIW